MALNNMIKEIWHRFQDELFPMLEEETGIFTKRHKVFIATLDMVPVETFDLGGSRGAGRPQQDRQALARAFIAKAVWNITTTRDLIYRLMADVNVRRLCGWYSRSDIPSEATFSRAFAEFAKIKLPERMHEALICDVYSDELVGHISRDSTAIAAREKPEPKDGKTGSGAQEPKPAKARGRGRPRKGEAVDRKPTRLQRQLDGAMSLGQMVEELPKACGFAKKKNSKGCQESWRGYKLHIRCRRWRHPDQLHPDLGAGAWQPSLHSALEDDRAAGDLSLRVDGRRL